MITKEQATERVKEWIRAQRRRQIRQGLPVGPEPAVYRIDADLRAHAMIQTIKGPLASEILDRAINDPEHQPQWGFFVDDAPEANWEHPCRYLFVLADGEILEVPESAPPSRRQNFAIEEVRGVFSWRRLYHNDAFVPGG